MAEHFSFFDAVLEEDGVSYDREYNAQQFTDYFKTLVTTGIMKGSGNMLAVSANGSSMVTSLNTGIAFIEGRYYLNDTPLLLAHDTETLGNSRIDRIVIRMNLSNEARYVKAFVKKGMPSTNPVAPALTQTPNLYEISLAQVKIVGGQTFIATNAVTDERGTNVICPWAGSNILPSYDDNALAEHMGDFVKHTPYAHADSTDGRIYTANIEGITNYVEGMAIAIKVTKTNTQVSYLNVNSLGARNILKAYGNSVIKGELVENMIYTLRYTGNHFVIQGDGIALNNTLTSTSTTEAATANMIRFLYEGKAGKSLETATLAAMNSWTIVGTVVKNEMGLVTLYIDAAGGLTTRGIQVTTLPVGFRPKTLYSVPAITYTGISDTTIPPFMLNIFPTGEVRLGLTSRSNFIASFTFPTV